MAKIISINDQVISIGTDDGGIEEIRSSDVNFVPHVGDEVEIFKTDSKIIVSKVEANKNTVPEVGHQHQSFQYADQCRTATECDRHQWEGCQQACLLHSFWERLESTSFMLAKPEPALRCCCFAGR